MHPYDPDPDTPPPLWKLAAVCTEPLKITYTVNKWCIQFEPCGFYSFRPQDIEKRYCPFCDRYMDLIAVAREVTKNWSE